MAAGDPFQKLKAMADQELDSLGLKADAKLVALWRRLDASGNGSVSLAEVNKLIQDMTSSNAWPAWMNNQTILKKAYMKTVAMDGTLNDEVHKTEFHALVLNVYWFCKLFSIFGVMDQDNSRSVDGNEFLRGMNQLGLNLSQQDAAKDWSAMDPNQTGQVAFHDFCAYIRKRVSPDHNPNFDSGQAPAGKGNEAMRDGHGHKATHTHYVAPKGLRDFDELEVKIKALCKDKPGLKALWGKLDFNGNGVVSLAEIDKFVVENYQTLNHKPALMRCYKCTISQGHDADEFIHRKDFKKFIVNLFYFNKMYWVFAEANDGDDCDRRMEFSEFKKCLAMCHCNLSEAEAQRDFKECDHNGGGMILFDEFCHYFAGKSCPQGMSDFVDDGVDRSSADGTGAVLKHAGHAMYHSTGHGHVARNSHAHHGRY
jgi:Ca2+-binding EF-hand superfamily protein